MLPTLDAVFQHFKDFYVADDAALITLIVILNQPALAAHVITHFFDSLLLASRACQLVFQEERALHTAILSSFSDAKIEAPGLIVCGAGAQERF